MSVLTTFSGAWVFIGVWQGSWYMYRTPVTPSTLTPFSSSYSCMSSRRAPRKVDHRFGVFRGPCRIADDRNDRRVLDVEERARSTLGQSPRHRLVDEVDQLRLERSRSGGRGRSARLEPCETGAARHPRRE